MPTRPAAATTAGHSTKAAAGRQAEMPTRPAAATAAGHLTKAAAGRQAEMPTRPAAATAAGHSTKAAAGRQAEMPTRPVAATAAGHPTTAHDLRTIQQHIVAEVRQTFAMAPDHEPRKVACALLTKDNGVYAHALAGAVLRSKLTVKEAAAKSVRFAEDCMKDKAGAI